MDLAGVKYLSAILAKTDPRKTRGFLDSTYAGIKHGNIVPKDKKTIFEFVRLLKHYGLTEHARKLGIRYIPFVAARPDIPFPIQIMDVCIHSAGVAKGFSTLSLGEKFVDSGPGWVCYEPVAHIIVPTGDFEPGQMLICLPENSTDIDLFFP